MYVCIRCSRHGGDAILKGPPSAGACGSEQHSPLCQIPVARPKVVPVLLYYCIPAVVYKGSACSSLLRYYCYGSISVVVITVPTLCTAPVFV